MESASLTSAEHGRLAGQARFLSWLSLGYMALERGYGEWDIEALLSLYADEVELIQIDRDNPPSSPRVRQGKEVFKGMFEHCAAAGVKARVENFVAGQERAAATITCEFPGWSQGRGELDPRARGRSHRPRARRSGGRPEAVSPRIACRSAGDQRD